MQQSVPIDADVDITKAYLDELISDGVEERSDLEYKAAEALSPESKIEITKDVSAFANSAGGMLIYGIREHKVRAKKHLPEEFDPVNQSKFPKERLEHFTSLIQPVIRGLRIIPINIGPATSDFCFVVQVPKGETAHQALDRKYYRRRNFESVPTEDYEIREVINRRKHPRIGVRVRIDNKPPMATWIRIENLGEVMALHYRVNVFIPYQLSGGNWIVPAKGELHKTEDLRICHKITISNLDGIPLFPDSVEWVNVGLKPRKKLAGLPPDRRLSEISITVHADNMPAMNLTKDVTEVERGLT